LYVYLALFPMVAKLLYFVLQKNEWVDSIFMARQHIEGFQCYKNVVNK